MKRFLLISALIASYICAAAQEFNCTPPVVYPDGRVEFKIFAPNAQSVGVMTEGACPLTRNEKGEWTGISEPMLPGFHYYFIMIDGIQIVDPASPAYFGFGYTSSGIETPYPEGDNRFSLMDVPHGTVGQIRYFSKVNDDWKRMFVYTPPQYNPKKKYPVLYLIHGGGENETGWFNQGKADVLIDNMLASGEVVPMIVVALDGNTKDFFTELTTECIPLVESSFKVKKGSENRAIAGLSKGGIQTLESALSHPELFGHVGVLSSGFFNGTDNHRISNYNKEDLYAKMAADPAYFNKQFKTFFLSQGGPKDIAYENCAAMRERFDEIGIKYIYFDTPGGHSWHVWRESLYQFAPHLFK